MKNIIIFGATGKIGCYTALFLKEEGYNVIAVGKRVSDNDFFLDHNIKYISLNILNPNDYKKLPQQDIYGVVDMAAILPATMNGYDPRLFVEYNIYGTMNILDYGVNAGMQRFVFPRTWADIQYLLKNNHPISSDATSRFPLNDDHTMYTITKNAAVDIVQHYAIRYGFKYYVLRLPNVFCYHPNPTYYVDGKKRWTGQHVIIEQARKGQPIELWGNPDCK